MATNRIKQQIDSNSENLETLQIEKALRDIQPQTKLGSKLIELSLKGLKSGVQPMTTEEISEYLGRTRTHENIH